MKGEWVNFWLGTPLSDRLLIPVVDARIAVTADTPFDAGIDTSSAEVVMAYPRCFSVSRGQLVALSSASLASGRGQGLLIVSFASDGRFNLLAIAVAWRHRLDSDCQLSNREMPQSNQMSG